jgi:hypothetical protein
MVKEEGHRSQYNRVHAPFMLDNEGYKHTLRIFNTYCTYGLIISQRLNKATRIAETSLIIY